MIRDEYSIDVSAMVMKLPRKIIVLERTEEELDQLKFKVWSLIRRTHKELTPTKELLGTQESAIEIINLVLNHMKDKEDG